MRRQPVLEKAIVARIVAALKKVPGVVVRKRHGTVMGMGGDPDLYGSLNGKHFEIEVKRPFDPKSQLTKLQGERQYEWRVQGGAIVGVARNVDEAFAILGIGRQVTIPHDAVWLCSGCHEYRWKGAEPPARCPNCGHRHFEQDVSA